MTKSKTSSPTVSLEMISCAIDTKDNRYMVVTDIPMHILMKNFTCR